MIVSARYIVAVNLLLLALIAYSAASMTGKAVAARMVSAPEVAIQPPPSPIPAPKRQSARHYAMIYERDPFNSVQPTPAGKKPPPPPPPPKPLKVSLQGVSVHSAGGSYCIITGSNKKQRKQRLYRIGEAVGGTDAKVKRVEWDKCVLDRNGKEEVLVLQSPVKRAHGKGVRPGVARPRKRGRNRFRARDANIEKVSETEYVIARDEVDSALENMNQLFTQIRAVPHFEGGKAIGFRLFAIRHGSLFDKIGLRNGDILQKINGVAINDPSQALAMLEELRHESDLDVAIIRSRQPKSLNYKIQ